MMSMQHTFKHRHLWAGFASGIVLILGLGLFLIPSAARHFSPVMFIRSEQPTVQIENPYIHDGEVETEIITLHRGQRVRVLQKEAHSSLVHAEGKTFSVDNALLAPTLASALHYDQVYPRHLINLRTSRNGTLSDIAVTPDEPLEVEAIDPFDLNPQTGEIAWIKVRKDGQPYYVSGKSVTMTPPTTAWQSTDLDLEGYPQPDFIDNPRLKERSGIHVSLENLIYYEPQILSYMKRTGMNTLVVSIKGPEGKVQYESSAPESFFKNPQNALSSSLINLDSLHSLVERIKKEGIYPIARIETFQDSALAADSPELAITDQEQNPLSIEGQLWTSPYNRTVWQYNLALAKEAAQAGFSEVEFDFCTLPQPEGVDETTIDWKNAYNETPVQAIQNFLYYAREELEPLHTYTGSDIAAEEVYDDSDDQTARIYPAMAAASNVVNPMGYLEVLQMLPANHGIEVFGSASDVMASFSAQAASKASGSSNSADVCVWIQGFGLMSPQTLRNQINGVHQGGVNAYLIWTDDGNLNLLLPLESAFETSQTTSAS